MTPGIYSRHIAEDQLDGRRLGRHVAHDPRSRNYVAETAKSLTNVRHQAVGLPLDQGNIGSCTANALIGAGNSQPKPVLGNETDAVRLYEVETRLEGEPYPPNDPGGTGLYVCRAAKQEGLIHTYRHAFGISQALRALVLHPVITGINWYDSFDQPDRTGMVRITASASVRGGHEVVADEIDAVKTLVWFWNSWGLDWGAGGRFCMSFDTWKRLLEEQGDVTVPYFNNQ